MLDFRLIRERAEFVKEEIGKLGETAPIDEIVALDIRRREILTQVEQLRADRNEGSKEIGRKAAGPERDAQITAMRELGQRIEVLDQELKEVDTSLDNALMEVPNLPDPDVPIGASDEENVMLGEFGNKREFDFEPRPHWELGEELGIIDFERGVKISGSRFYLLKGAGARLQRALISLFSRCSHPRTWLHRNLSTGPRAYGNAGRHRTDPEIRRRSVQDDNGRPLANSDG